MDRYNIYKVIHILGIALAFAAVGGLNVAVVNGATKATNQARKLISALHGTALFLLLLGGFGMLARLGLVQGHAFPGWLWGKIVVWVLLGGVIAIPYRKPELAKPLFIVTPFLAAVAAWLAIYKPF
jgi:uncharacterized membrane protein SirB2